MKKYLLYSLFLTITLSGCSNDKMMQELAKTEKVNANNNKVKVIEATENKEKEALYESLEKPLDELIKENDLDKSHMTEVKTVEKKTEYEDGNEFSQYAAKILYQFYTSQISGESYYKFLHQYGSEETKKQLPSRQDAIGILNNLQEMYKSKNVHGENYELTEVRYNRLDNEGHFYRKVLTTNGLEYFITTIVREDKSWKFEQDEPSPPFEEELN